MSWPMVSLSRVATINPRCPKDIDENQLVSFVAMASASEEGILLQEEIRVLGETKKGFTYFEKEDVLLAKITPCFENGKSLRPFQISKQVGFGSTEFHVVRADEKKLLPQYLFYLLWSNAFRFAGEHAMSGAAGQKRVGTDFLKNFEIPLPPLDEQKRIAAILDKADAIRQKRKQAIALADEFLRSVFLDMFGDPVTNPKGWDTGSMADFGEFKNGLNYSRDESGVELSYIGVGDFKSHSKLESIEKLSTIQLNENPDDSYLLKDNDLLFVRSNGNRALVGRCLTVHPREKKVTFSGFCIRYRVQRTEKLNPTFVNYCMRMPSMKNAMLKGGQGANIQNINQKTLISLLLPIPPQELQKGFEDLVNQYQRFSERSLVGSNADDALFLSLSQKAFSGQL